MADAIYTDNKELIAKLIDSYVEKTGHEILPLNIYTPKQTIFHAGRKAHGVYFIQSGSVQVFRPGQQGEDVLLRVASSGTFLGIGSTVDRTSMQTTAISAVKSELQFIPKTIFLKLLQTDADFCKVVIDNLVDQCHDAEKRILDLVSLDSKQRLAAMLISLELAFDHDEKFRTPHIRTARKDIAHSIGVTPETVSRLLAEFKKNGLIQRINGYIEILDRSALRRLACISD